MDAKVEAKLERAIVQIEALDERMDSLKVQARSDLDELKLIFDRFTHLTVTNEKVRADKQEIREEKMDMRVRSLEFWRWMLFGAFTVLTVLGSMSWYLTSNIMLDEIRNIRNGLKLPDPAVAVKK